MRVLILAASLLLLAACGKSPEDAAVGAMSGGKVDKDGDKVTVATDQGAVTYNTEAGQALPAAFPKDAFLPAGYTVRSSMDTPGGLTVDVEAAGSTADAFAQAGKAMTAQGWAQTAAVQSGGQSLLVFQKDDATMQYTFDGQDPGKVHVVVYYVPKQQP
jgi:hypothetical protein